MKNNSRKRKKNGCFGGYNPPILRTTTKEENLTLPSNLMLVKSWSHSTKEVVRMIGDTSIQHHHYIEPNLDLSWNDFDYTQIPSFLGSMVELTYLNLSHASFAGKVPPHLGNLSIVELVEFGILENEIDDDHIIKNVIQVSPTSA
ncbi:hypothetical protein Csa_000015 [Cucumis sativus]|nr:hypothetical protein Csa_000015 [Cucumis sativus]